ncbi:GntR family transcriptional regulator [Rhizobium sp. Leaf384]|uniref:FadR/GntR family transcriptional regulator n=1 Tax=unclassified Rhizobium TaxID=2613769 RepID=UPI000712BC35|nr:MULTISPECIES: FadR/GntR family transcriptional regulator [unclassified Rhizobium]KQS75705.1 GntR family transcriptional regulator [Rhizobium sp. Leaf384]KQS75954.1 GntR family transcriptional regulator [Rhizobium sp. Leaf383]
MTMDADAPDPFPAAARRRETLSSQVVRTLAERIRQGEYARGSQLPTEKVLIDELGVSRTVIREAIANLRASGLVAIQHGVGAFVRDDAGIPPFRLSNERLTMVENQLKGLELRIGIESEAAALAAERRTQSDLDAMTAVCDAMDAAIERVLRESQTDFEFHCAVAKASQNEHFFGIFNYLGETLMPRMRLQSHAVADAVFQANLNRVNAEHRRVLAAIVHRDIDGARLAMREHLTVSRDRMIERMRLGG